MRDLTVAFIGLGLIGGSIAKGLKRSAPNIKIMAYMRTRKKLEQAQREQIVDVILDGIDETLLECDILFLCTPVEYNTDYLTKIRPFLKQGAIVTDVSSTKTEIHRTVAALGMESCFIGGHPMAGSEKTGYEHATDHLLENAYYILTPTPKTKPSDLELLTELAKTIGAMPLILDYQQHDFSVAAISHLPHLIASSLVNLVHDNDNEEQLMKRLAAGGFKDITRIASSSPIMWEQICMTNTENISLLLQKYIASLTRLAEQLKTKEETAIYQLFESSRDYRNSFAESSRGALAPEYSFSVDIVDEPGAISIISSILAGKGINIKNIGIDHNRERGEGALRISFYDEASKAAAIRRLESFNYTLFP